MTIARAGNPSAASALGDRHADRHRTGGPDDLLRSAAYIFATDLGADPLGVRDSSWAINLAISKAGKAAALGGLRSVYLGPGTFRLDTTAAYVSVDSIEIWGAGMGQTTLDVRGAWDGIKTASAGGTGRHADHLRIHDLTVDGTNSGSTGGHGLNLHIGNSRIWNVHVKAVKKVAIRLNHTDVIDQAGLLNEVYDCHIESAGAEGIKYEYNYADSWIRGNNVGSTGPNIRGWAGPVRILYNHLNGSPEFNLYYDNGCDDTVIAHNVCEGARFHGIYFQATGSDSVTKRMGLLLDANVVRDSAQADAPGACTAALAGAGAGNVNTGTHSYKVTFVAANGETAAGTASNVVTTDTATNGQVNLTAIPTGTALVSARRIYRTEAGGGTYKLLATVGDNTTTTYSDNVADGSLGAAAPAANQFNAIHLEGNSATRQFRGVAVSNNDIRYTGSTAAKTPLYAVYGNHCQEAAVSGNTVHNLQSGKPPFKFAGTSSLNRIKNNAPGDFLFETRITSAVTVSNTATETALLSRTVNGGDLQISNSARAVLDGTYLNNSGAGRTLRIRAKYGATTAIDVTVGSFTSSAATRAFRLTAEVMNLGAANSQLVKLTGQFSSYDAATAGDGSAGRTEAFQVELSGTAAIDSTADQTLAVTVEHSAASAALTVTGITTFCEMAQSG